MSSSKSDGPQLVAENIAAITEATNNVSYTLNSNFNTVDTMLDHFQSGLINSLNDIDRLLCDNINLVKILDNFIHRKEGQLVLKAIGDEDCHCPSMESRFLATEDEIEIEKEHAENLCSRDGKGLEDLPPTTDLLKKTHETLVNVEKTASYKFDSFIGQPRRLENEVHDSSKGCRERANEIQKKLYQLQVSIKTQYKRSSGGAKLADGEGKVNIGEWL